MALMLVSILVALIFTWILTTKLRQPHPEVLTEPRTALPILGVQIICGDCSGDEHFPIKTHLDRLGRCDQCGGQSFILASNRAAYAKRLIATRLSANEASTKRARVLAFEGRHNGPAKIA